MKAGAIASAVARAWKGAGFHHCCSRAVWSNQRTLEEVRGPWPGEVCGGLSCFTVARTRCMRQLRLRTRPCNPVRHVL